MHDFKHYLKITGEYGEVVGIKESLVVIEGLPKVKLNELVLFEMGAVGQVMTIEETQCQIMIFDKELPTVGEKAARTDDFISIDISQDMLGMMIDPLGRTIYPSKVKCKGEKTYLFKELRTRIWERAKVTEPFTTGVTIIDMLLPIGAGQKELIIGDRKTGKTSFLLTTVKNQIKNNRVVIFAAIGKKKTDIRQLLEYFEKEKILDNIVFVTSSSDDSSNLIYLTPFTAMAVAEYFKSIGRDSLVILDDLSNHARFYREIALISNKFPGRESYPGDIFYLQASLLERAGNFHKTNNTNLKFEISNLKSMLNDLMFKNLNNKNSDLIKNLKLKIKNYEEQSKRVESVSITCLPVAEVVEGDFTGYITTNLMGITDGHIFFDRAIYAKGKRPAINFMMSVTRVGRQTQSRLIQQINHEVTAFLSEYESMKNLSHFGAELSESIRNNIKKGKRIEYVLEQNYDIVLPLSIQIILLVIAYSQEFVDIDIKKIKENFLLQLNDQAKIKFFEELIDGNDLTELKKKLLASKQFLI